MKGSLRLLVLLALWFPCFQVAAQSPDKQAQDSLWRVAQSTSGPQQINALLNYSSTLIPDWDSTVFICEEALALANQTNDSSLIRKAAFSTLDAYSYLERHDDVIRIGEAYLPYFSTSKDTLPTIRFLNLLGAFGYFPKGNINRQIECQQKAFDLIYRSPNWTRQAAQIAENLMIGYHSVGKNREARLQLEKVRTTAIEYQDSGALAKVLIMDGQLAYKNDRSRQGFQFYYKAYQIGVMIENQSIWMDACERLGQCYMVDGTVDSAFYYFDKVQKINIEEGDFPDILHIQFLRGKTYLNAGMGEEALEILKPLRETYDSLGHKIRVVDVGYSLGKVYSLIGQSQKGIQLLLKNIEMARGMNYRRGLFNSFENLGDIYRITENWEGALAMQDSLLKLTEQNFQDQQSAIEEQIVLQEEYQRQLLEQAKLETLNLDLQQKNRNRNVIIVLVGACVLVVLAFYLLIRRSLRTERKLTQSLDQKIAEQTQDLRQSLSDIQEANDDLRKFAFIASHNFKSGIRTVNIMSDLISKKLDGREEQINPFLAHIKTAGSSMDDTLEGLQTYFSLRGESVEHQDIQLASTLEIAIQRIRETVPSAVIHGEIQAALLIRGHASELSELFFQLIKNACVFTKEDQPPTVWIDAQSLPHEVQIRISDQGIGIPEAYQEKVFDAFFRMHPESEYPGSGIGLAIAKRITRRHQGTLSVESSSDQGTTFLLTLPYSPQR